MPQAPIRSLPTWPADKHLMEPLSRVDRSTQRHSRAGRSESQTQLSSGPIMLTVVAVADGANRGSGPDVLQSLGVGDGRQYTASAYRHACDDVGITQSMGTVGDSYPIRIVLRVLQARSDRRGALQDQGRREGRGLLVARLVQHNPSPQRLQPAPAGRVRAAPQQSATCSMIRVRRAGDVHPSDLAQVRRAGHRTQRHPDQCVCVRPDLRLTYRGAMATNWQAI